MKGLQSTTVRLFVIAVAAETEIGSTASTVAAETEIGSTAIAVAADTGTRSTAKTEKTTGGAHRNTQNEAEAVSGTGTATGSPSAESMPLRMIATNIIRMTKRRMCNCVRLPGLVETEEVMTSTAGAAGRSGIGIEKNIRMSTGVDGMITGRSGGIAVDVEIDMTTGRIAEILSAGMATGATVETAGMVEKAIISARTKGHERGRGHGTGETVAPETTVDIGKTTTSGRSGVLGRSGKPRISPLQETG